MPTERRVEEFDILAYADGRLEADPPRLAEVERALEANPELAARAEAYRAQTVALRRAYRPRLAEPVPEALRASLDRSRRWSDAAAVRIAALVLLAVAAGAAGWLIGRSGEDADDPAIRALLDHTGPSAVVEVPQGARLAQGGSAAPMTWLSGEIAVRLRAPDLSKLGFTLVERSTVEVRGRRVVRLTYGSADGSRFHLFLRPRWTERGPAVRFAEAEGTHFAYWAEGPLSSAVASDLPRTELSPIVDAIRAALKRGGAEPTIGIEESAAAETPANHVSKGVSPRLSPAPSVSPEMRPISEADPIPP